MEVKLMTEELQETETTRGEKILAAAMVGFLLISGIQILNELQQIPDYPDFGVYELKYGVDIIQQDLFALSEDQRVAFDILDTAKKQYETADRDYWFAASEYDLMLESGDFNETIESRYENARASYETATSIYESSQVYYDDINSQMDELRITLNTQQTLAWNEHGRALRVYQVKVLVLRLAFTIPLFASSIILFIKVRTRISPYMIHTNVFMAFSSILLAYMILDYLWSALSIITISLIGAALSAIALAYLKKTIFSNERISRSRLRKQQCLWCGYPLSTTSDDEYCRDCGRQVRVKCHSCHTLRSINLPFCQHCGHPTKPS